MGIHRTVIAVLVCICGFNSFATDQSKIDELAAGIKNACEKPDIEALKKLHYFEGVPEALVDQCVYGWEVWLLDYVPKQNWSFDTVEFYPKDEYLARPTVNKQAVASMSEPTKMNGHLYGPSLDVIGFVSIKFKKESGGESGHLRAVGVAPDGSLRMTGLRRV